MQRNRSWTARGAAVGLAGFTLALAPVVLQSWQGAASFDKLGKRVACAGDVTGDGIPDLIVGSPERNSQAGRVTLFSGTGALIRVHDGTSGADFFGDAVAGLGDLDGDGRADYGVGARADDTPGGGFNAGSVTVYSGATGIVLWSRDGIAVSEGLGTSIAPIADLNADGTPDVLVGAPRDASSEVGRAYVLSGRTGAVLRTVNGPAGAFGFGAAIAATTDASGDGVADFVVGASNSNRAYLISGASGTILWALSGPSGSSFGLAVAGTGDVDRDGRGDFVVGSFNEAGSTAAIAGRVRMYSGATGLVLWTRFGAAAGDRFGEAVAWAGDVNSDGIPDVIVGAPGHDASGADRGAAWVVNGRDGADIAIVLGGTPDNATLGASVARAGDLNHDCNDDVIVGAPMDNTGGTQRGSAKVFDLQAHVDPDPPVVTITAPANGLVTNALSVAVSATVSDASTFTVTSTPAGIAGSFEAGTYPVGATLPLADEGNNLIAVNAVDCPGHTGGVSITVIRDTIDPAVTITSPLMNAILGDSPAAVTVAVVDATPTVVTFGANRIELAAGGGIATGSVPLVSGPNVIPIVVVDAAGNRTTKTLQVTLDDQAPIVAITTPADGATFGPGQATVTVIASVEDLSATTADSAPAGVTGALPPGGGYASGPVTLAEGLNTITVRATDATSKLGSASITVRLDTTPPAVAIVAPGNGGTVRGTIDLDATADDGGTGVTRVELFAGPTLLATLTQAPFEYLLDTTTLADGAHQLRAVAFDAKGNSNADQVGITVDNTPPMVAITAPAENAIVTGTIPFVVGLSDATSGVVSVTMQVQGQAPTGDASAAYSGPVASDTRTGSEDTTRWPDGPLTLTARAVDAAGHETLAVVHVIVSNATPPTCDLTPRNGRHVRGSVQLVATAAGTFSQIELKVDGLSFATSTTSPLSVTLDSCLLLDGTLKVEAVVTGPGGQTTCVSLLTIDNMSFMDLDPESIDIRQRKHERDPQALTAHVEGKNVALLRPTESRVIELRVPGGSPVRATTGWSGDDVLRDKDHDQVPELRIRFNRNHLEAALRAGIAAGAIDTRPRKVMVPVTLFVDGRELGRIRVHLTGLPGCH